MNKTFETEEVIFLLALACLVMFASGIADLIQSGVS